MEKYNKELYHYGVPGMRWGHRKTSYKSTDIRSAIARRSNEKVDEGFKNGTIMLRKGTMLLILVKLVTRLN